MFTVHKTAKEGFTDGSHYDQFRPSYPTEMVEYLIGSLHASSNTGVQYNILELGAGTGLFTRKALSILPKKTKYLATDPSVDFLSVLRAQSQDLETKIMFASNIPLPDASVENIVCAQCFHWFSTEESLNEMTRVLVPHGRIMLIFINKNLDIPWLRKLDELQTSYYGDTPRMTSRQWLRAMTDFKLVKLVEHKIIDVPPPFKGDKQFILNHFRSISVISRLDEAEKAQVSAKMQAVLDEYFTDDEEIPLHVDSELYCVEKL